MLIMLSLVVKATLAVVLSLLVLGLVLGVVVLLVMLGLLLEVPVPLMVWLKVPKGLEARDSVIFLSPPRFIFLFIEGTGS